MAATLHHPPQTSASTNSVSGANDSNKNPQLKRIVYSKYRELLGSYNDKANAIIETLPAYMVREDRGFNFVASGPPRSDSSPVNAASKYSPADEMYGQRGGGSGGGGYEAPACVQNAMMTKDKKPFTYTPGGIDLSQIKSERMAKRLARNAQAEGATGASQQNRPTQPVSSNGGGGSPVGATSAMGAAALGMPFQVLPPPPPPQPGAAAVGKKSFNGNPAPPPPPPQSSLAPPNNGRTSAPNSPSMARKSPTPQRFEPPPLGFRPEIKIPSNPMAALRKVPPPVEKNTFWKDEYVKERSKSPMPDNDNSASGGSPSVGHAGTVGYGEQNQYGVNGKDLVDVAARKPGTPQQQLPETGGYNNYAPYIPTPPAPLSAPQQHQQNIKPPTPPTPPQQQSVSPHTPCSEFRSVPVPQSPAVSIYTRQADSPLQQQRATESPFRYAQQQQMQSEQQQRPPIAISPLAQQSTSPVAAPSATDSAHQPQTQTVPWRIQRNQPAAATQPQQQSQSIYNNVQNQQRSRDVFSPGKMEPTTTASSPQLPQNYSTQQLQYQGPKPTNVGSLYIAPLGPTTSEPQAQNIIRQQLQQEQTRDSPMRQIPQQQQQLGWLRSQPASKEQVPWARAEENGNVLPSSLRSEVTPQQQESQPQYSTEQYQPLYNQKKSQGNGFPPAQQQQPPQNFGAQGASTVSGLRLQINSAANSPSTTTNQSGPKERIIPITLEQTPTYAAAQPNFGAPAGHIIRSANQFVDQGYNNFPAPQQQQPQQRQTTQPPQQQSWREQSVQRFASPTQQTQQPNLASNNTRIIPIAVEGVRGPISPSPVVLQNDPRSPPIQSKSFRILQKITDTVDDGNPNGSTNNNSNINSVADGAQQDGPSQLQRPQFARQMSAQQARNSPSVEQMRRLQLQNNTNNNVQEQTKSASPWQQQGNTSAQPNHFVQQRSSYDMPQQYVPPSEQQVPEPKKYTGSAIPSRSFKILQAMTTPENAGPGQSDL